VASPTAAEPARERDLTTSLDKPPDRTETFHGWAAVFADLAGRCDRLRQIRFPEAGLPVSHWWPAYTSTRRSLEVASCAALDLQALPWLVRIAHADIARCAAEFLSPPTDPVTWTRLRDFEVAHRARLDPGGRLARLDFLGLRNGGARDHDDSLGSDTYTMLRMEAVDDADVAELLLASGVASFDEEPPQGTIALEGWSALFAELARSWEQVTLARRRRQNH